MPLCFATREVFPDFGRMVGLHAVFQQISRDMARHEGARRIPRTRYHNRIAAVIEHMHKMPLERRQVAAAMEGDKSCFVETNLRARCQNLRGGNTGQRLDRMAASAFDAFQILEAAEMDVAHEHHYAALAGVMCSRDQLDLVA